MRPLRPAPPAWPPRRAAPRRELPPPGPRPAAPRRGLLRLSLGLWLGTVSPCSSSCLMRASRTFTRSRSGAAKSPTTIISGPATALTNCPRSTSAGGSVARLFTSSSPIVDPSRIPPRIWRTLVSRAALLSALATATGSPSVSRNAIAVGPSSSASSASAPASSAARRVSVFLTTWKRAPCSRSSPRSLSMSVTVNPR